MVVNNKMIGQRIKQRRETLNISQVKLGEITGVTYQQIQKYEKGTNKVSPERLSHIAKTLGVPLSYFFEETDEFIVSEKQEDKVYGIPEKKILSLQELELLKNFRSLPDKDARSNLVEFLKSISNK